MKDPEVMYQACCLADALHRNINDNFESISFEVEENGDIQVKVVLTICTPVEIDYIDDMSAEFSVVQESDIVKKFDVVISEIDRSELPFLVYRKLEK